jgi:hypothetical protein
MKKVVTIPFYSSLLIFLFAYTAFNKFSELGLFAATLSRMPLIGTGAAVLAPAVPLAELVIVLLLLFPATRLKGLYVSLAALSLFTVYLVLMLLFVPHLPCSCGGVISGMGWWAHVGMNVGLVG